MLEQVGDRDRQVVVGRQQARAAGDDAVPVMIGVAGEGDVEAILQPDQPLHRIGRGRIHADLAVPIHGHEAEGRIDRVVDDGQIEPVALARSAPSSARRRRRADPRPGGARAANRLHIDHVAEIGDIGCRDNRADVWSRCAAPARRNPLDAAQASRQQLVGACSRSSPVTSVSAGPPLGGLYLKPPSSRRIVRRSDDDAVGEPATCVRGYRSEWRARRPGSGCIRRSRASMTSTPFAASTSSALASAGSDSAWVSIPRNSGPSMPLLLAVLADGLA